MDYKKIYDRLMESRLLVKSDRELKRRNREERYELHHIVPRSWGGSDEVSNLVQLTFREHFVAHKLLFKIAKSKKDSDLIQKSYAALSAMLLCSKDDTFPSRRTSSYYAKARKYYWDNYKPEYHPMYGGGKHTDEGIKRLSLARTGTMPVKDAITGEMKGSVSVNHPKVISGEWVHHSTGRIIPEKEREERRKRTKGMGNPNARSELTKEYLINLVAENIDFVYDKQEKKIIKTNFERIFAEVCAKLYPNKTVHPYIIIRNRFGSVENFLLETSNNLEIEILGIKPPPRKRPNRGSWYTNQENSISKLFVAGEQPAGWTKGRKINVRN